MDKLNIPKVTLNDGNTIPAVGLGTWRSDKGAVKQAVIDAIEAGYRHIDCALIYGNEDEVGEGIAEKIADNTVKREDLFITGKLWNTMHSAHLVMDGLKQTLSNLRTTYLDLYLIHWPLGYKEGGELLPVDSEGVMQFSDVDYVESWPVMEEAVEKGFVKSIGLSNFNKSQILRILETAKKVKPAVLQIEIHPYLHNEKLIEFCHQKGIHVTAYSPLGSPDRPWAKPGDTKLLDEPKLVAIADKYKKTSAQILIRYALHRGLSVIPKSITKSRIIENIQVMNFSLSDEDMATIRSFECNGRLVFAPRMCEHPLFPFHDEY